MPRKLGVHQEHMRRAALVLLTGGLFLTAAVSVYVSATRAATDEIRVSDFKVQPAVMASVVIGGRRFLSEVMLTEAEHAHGLSGQPSLPEDRGMLFVFRDASRRVFWMDGMHFPIDMIFIRQNKIVEIASDMSPPVDREYPVTHESAVLSDMVFEVPAGTAEKNSWKIGTPIKVEYLPQ